MSEKRNRGGGWFVVLFLWALIMGCLWRINNVDVRVKELETVLAALKAHVMDHFIEEPLPPLSSRHRKDGK